MAGGKIAELFAEIGVKVDKDELAKLTQLESLLKGIAVEAGKVKEALGALQGALKIPTTPASAVPTTPASATKAEEKRAKKEKSEREQNLTDALMGKAPEEKTTAEKEGVKALVVFAKQLLGIGSIAFALKSVISSIAGLTKASMGASFGLNRFILQTGLSTEELIRWKRAGAAAGVSQEEVTENLSKLAQQTAEIWWGQHTEQAGAMGGILGVDWKARSTDISQQFGQAMKGKTMAEALMFGRMIGLTPNFSYMMWANAGKIPELRPGEGLSTQERNRIMILEKDFSTLSIAASNLTDRMVSLGAALIDLPIREIGNFFRGYNMLLNPAGPSPAVPRANFQTSSIVHQTNVSPATITVNVHEASDPNASVRAFKRVLSDAGYQSPAPWFNPVIQ